MIQTTPNSRAFSLGSPIQLRTTKLALSRNNILISTEVLEGNGIVVDVDEAIYREISRLRVIQMTIATYDEILQHMRLCYPVEVSGKITENDWGRILSFHEGNEKKALKWAEAFVTASTGINGD